MRTVQLGNDTIPAIAIGTWSWGVGINGGKGVFGNTYGFEDLFPVFEAGIKNGLTLWDTAAVYGMGASEAILGECIQKTNPITLSTKFTPMGFQTKKAMEKYCNKSIERLHQSSVDLYWVHNPANVKKWTNQAIALYQSGKIKHIGVSNHNLNQIKEASKILEAKGIHLDAVQNHYSILYRCSEQEGIIDWCEKNNTRFFAYMVLEQGALTGRFTETNPFPAKTRRAKAFPPKRLKELEPLLIYMGELAKTYQADISQIAIAWAIAKKTIPLVGATKVSQIESILKADGITLTVEEIEEMENQALKTGVSVKASWE